MGLLKARLHSYASFLDDPVVDLDRSVITAMGLGRGSPRCLSVISRQSERQQGDGDAIRRGGELLSERLVVSDRRKRLRQQAGPGKPIGSVM